jgi:quinol---cytochrome c reductase iron-sulfur subunit, bacillus type
LSEHHDEKPHLPPPSLWPVGFAIGIACVLVGLVVSWPVAGVGAVLTLVFGFLWVRDVTRDLTRPVEELPAEPAEEEDVGPEALDDGVHAYPRSVFLELSTLGLGAVIGGIVTVPVLGFAVLPSFTNQEIPEADLGPIENFPEGQFVTATYLEDPELGEVSRRTVFVRNNGFLGDVPSFTILFSRCVHLGCPVQPNGPPVGEPKKYKTVSLTPVQPASFGCPCHGGQYDTEGRRIAGPPVRSMDRLEFSIKDGNLVVGDPFSVGEIEGDGKNAKMQKYGKATPGVHVDGIEAWLYPIEVPS